VHVVLVKLGRGTRAIVGRLVRTPRKGSVIVVEFFDGMHEYVTTPVRRVLKVAGKDIYYVETANSRYRLEVRGKAPALEGASSGSGLAPPLGLLARIGAFAPSPRSRHRVVTRAP
jgi:hypothetical protein